MKEKARMEKNNDINGSNPQNVFRCPICDRKFRTAFRMKLHTEACHENVRKYRCNFNGCEYKSAWAKCMKTHINKIHGLTKIYKCNFEGCPKGFQDKKSLRIHIREHIGMGLDFIKRQ